MTKTKSHAKEPLIHITKRDASFTRGLVVRTIGVVLALIACGIFIVAFTGFNPIKVYTEMFKGSFGNKIKFLPSVHNAAILLCLSLAVTPAFKMKFWNLGAEGQALIGGLISAFIMLKLGESFDDTTLIIMMIAASVVGGAVWALIPAVCKALWNTNETLFTLMMNYVAMVLVNTFIMASDKSGHNNLGIINERTGYGYLPKLFGYDYIFNIIISVILTVFLFIYLKYSKQGYEISVVGGSENTARYVGINVKKVIIRTVAISGAIAGLVGFMLVAGDQHTLKDDIISGRGFTAVMVSWMSKFNPAIMVLVSVLIVFLSDGGKSATAALKVDNSIGDIMTAVVIFFLIGCEFFIRYKVNFRHSKKEVEA